MNNQIATTAVRESSPHSPTSLASTHNADAREETAAAPIRTAITLLTGGRDPHYALGLASALIAQGIALDFIGSDQLEDPELRTNPLVRCLNLRKEMRSNVSLARKVLRVLLYYARLLAYAAMAKPKLFHILWNNKFAIFDRTVLMLYYRALGKRIVLTAHNVNAGQRDGNDSFVNRLTLRIQYTLADHIFVHTERMRKDLKAEFDVVESKVSVIPFGINTTVRDTDLSGSQARHRLGLTESHRVVLFFGNIAPYKGLEYLVDAMAVLIQKTPDYRLIIAGRLKNCDRYWDGIRQRLSNAALRSRVIERIEFVPDEETEIYFKAADVLVLPYTYIYQSGVLLLGYSFGLPVIASDVGSLAEDVVEERTGFVCKPRDPEALAKSIERYFSSDLFGRRESFRREIKDFAAAKYSWARVGDITRGIYESLTC